MPIARRLVSREAPGSMARRLVARRGTCSLHSCRFDYPGNLKVNSISGIRCPEVKLYREQGEIFLLRCDYKEALVPNTTCEGVVAVQCNQGTAMLILFHYSCSLVTEIRNIYFILIYIVFTVYTYFYTLTKHFKIFL